MSTPVVMKKDTATEEKQNAYGHHFGAPRIRSFIKKRVPADIQLPDSSVLCLTTGAQYLAAEILELAGNATIARPGKHVTIDDQDIAKAINADTELKATLSKFTVFHATGQLPPDHPSLLTKKAKRELERKKKAAPANEPKALPPAPAPAPAPKKKGGKIIGRKAAPSAGAAKAKANKAK